MATHSQVVGRDFWKGLAMVIWLASGLSARAGDGEPAGIGPRPKSHKWFSGHPSQSGPGVGTLGYGPPGLSPGFQGFGLGYHLGYGYGGQALGPGAFGGYPYYSGPGYPHPWPRLHRFGHLNPFPYDGGPGSPTPDCPHYFGGVGPLVADRPVIAIERGPGEAPSNSGFGPFTGTLPYSESDIAPFTTRAASGGSASGVSTAVPATSAPPTPSSNPLR